MERFGYQKMVFPINLDRRSILKRALKQINWPVSFKIRAKIDGYNEYLSVRLITQADKFASARRICFVARAFQFGFYRKNIKLP